MYVIFWVSFGSSPTQIIAVLSFLSFKCLSIQFADAFNFPSSNHLIRTSSLLYFTSLIFLYGLIQVILFPSFFQKALLFLIDSLYFFWYWALFARPLFIHSGFVLNINSEEAFSLFFIFFIIFFFKLDFLFRIFFFFGVFFFFCVFWDFFFFGFYGILYLVRIFIIGAVFHDFLNFFGRRIPASYKLL